MIFFVSHAHAVRVAGLARPDSDPWVSRFFGDLAAAVGEDGFYDGLLDPAQDRKQQLGAALGTAQVFVPLYSPQYFGNSWATAELASFRHRLRRLGPAEAARHVVPVVWTPLPPWEHRPEVDEAFTVVGKNTDYAENGLRALCMLSLYRASYQTLVSAFAERIARVVRDSPLRPSAPGPLDPRPVDTGEPALVVSLLGVAPEVGDRLIEVAERLGVPARILPLDQSARRPCVLLLDAATSPETVRDTVAGLPRWVIPVVLASASAPTRAITGILRSAGLPQVSPLRATGEFDRNAPLLVTEARKQYLRYGPVVTAPGGPRPSLRRNNDSRG
ncbi:TIR-like protein FxsC [Actinoplanes oblitus]|uniref:TIR-like protein FxsC n=1 Tax=Actinoplanes oblitus TaxID=3040509 RepID=A0ABY8W643_9ACTN|nr:TIR-like protein FxsC [Actinoplanes oblitus]WIM93173.1 TIR-like protein FxsC [Actinoplanes oblitus]